MEILYPKQYQDLDRYIAAQSRELLIGTNLRDIFTSFSQTNEGIKRELDLVGHGSRVGDYAARFGQFIGLEEEEQFRLWIGGNLHDIGKLVEAYPDRFPNILREEEQDILGLDQYLHAPVGGRLLRAIGFPLDIAALVENHHTPALEVANTDTTSDLTEIIRIWDIFDAITSERFGKPAQSFGQGYVQIMGIFYRNGLKYKYREAFADFAQNTLLK